MKKFFAIVLSALVISSAAMLSGCGSSESSNKSETTSSQSATTAAADTTAGTTAGTTAPATTKAQETTKATEKKSSAASSKASSSSVASSSVKSSQQSIQSSVASKAAEKKQSAQKSVSGPFSESDLVAVVKGKSVALNENMSNVLAKLGKANEVVSEASCRGVGEDKTYKYNGFTVLAVPFDGVDKVCAVTLLSGSTPKGVSVGDSESKVTQVYGNNYKKVGKFINYSVGDKSLMFLVKDGKVVEIDYNYDIL
ncbi:MAG TPA: hypothetical protein DEO32_01415 [Ruminococcaceae bacterium]|nr:hypothetical protein [Oscillospiraceae bacterium]